LANLEGQLAAAAELLPRGNAPPDPAAQLAVLNDWLAHVGTTSADQRAAIEAQYTRAAGTILAELSADPTAIVSAVVPASAGMSLPRGEVDPPGGPLSL